MANDSFAWGTMTLLGDFTEEDIVAINWMFDLLRGIDTDIYYTTHIPSDGFSYDHPIVNFEGIGRCNYSCNLEDMWTWLQSYIDASDDCEKDVLYRLVQKDHLQIDVCFRDIDTCEFFGYEYGALVFGDGKITYNAYSSTSYAATWDNWLAYGWSDKEAFNRLINDVTTYLSEQLGIDDIGLLAAYDIRELVCDAYPIGCLEDSDFDVASIEKALVDLYTTLHMCFDPKTHDLIEPVELPPAPVWQTTLVYDYRKDNQKRSQQSEDCDIFESRGIEMNQNQNQPCEEACEMSVEDIIRKSADAAANAVVEKLRSNISCAASTIKPCNCGSHDESDAGRIGGQVAICIGNLEHAMNSGFDQLAAAMNVIVDEIIDDDDDEEFDLNEFLPGYINAVVDFIKTLKPEDLELSKDDLRMRLVEATTETILLDDDDDDEDDDFVID